MATKTAAKVGKGLPGFGESQGSKNRIWQGGEFLLKIDEVTVKNNTTKEGDFTGYNVRVQTTCLGGPVQEDDTDPKGKKISLFINVAFDKPFTIDQAKDLFIAADVKTVGDEPPWAKLSGKQVVAKLGIRHAENGNDYQSCYWIPKKKSKSFGTKVVSDDDD